MLSISRNVRLSVCLSVCVSVCVFTFEVPFNGLFAPISRSRMSNIFRDSESLGKSNGKKWSNIWTFLFGSGLKSPLKKKLIFCWFCLGPPSYGIGATIRIGREMFCLPYAGFFSSIMRFLLLPDLLVAVAEPKKSRMRMMVVLVVLMVLEELVVCVGGIFKNTVFPIKKK